MALLWNGIVDGVLMGGVYALMAAGLTLIFGVMDIISVAQGIFVILGAYLSYSLEQSVGISLFVGLLITIPALFIIGLCVEWLFIRRLGKSDRVPMSILVTYAVALIVEGVLNIVYGTQDIELHASYLTTSVDIGGAHVPDMYLYGFALAVGILGLFFYILHRTRFGVSIQAAVQDRTAALLLGVDVKRVSTIVFGMGTAATAAGGMVFGATLPFNANSAEDLISRLLVVIVLGGLGSMAGALIASVFMLVVEDVVSAVWNPDWSTLIFFCLMAVVLLIRPVGLLGKAEVRTE
ncbi:MAG: branched-chain amino acid ABC transporter permease [Actinomycetota bacterium]|nr:branched-chain amino acid ABC transporter permease [Actinomycetota bacterium]